MMEKEEDSKTEWTLNEVIEWMEKIRESRMLVWQFDYGDDTKVTIITETPPEKWKKQEAADE